MSRNKFESSHNLFSQRYKLVTKSAFFWFFFVLAGLIFMFPTIIGTLFAIFILLTGSFVLVAGYYVWNTKLNQSHNLSSLDTEFMFSNLNYNKSRYYRFQNIRFIRW